MPRSFAALESHGFIDIGLSPDLSNLSDVLPANRDIARLGIPQWIHGVPWRFLDRSLSRDDHFVGWNIKELYDVGAYGKIYKAYRIQVKRLPDDRFVMASSVAQDVILKQIAAASEDDVLPLRDVKAHFSESLLHVLAWRTLQASPLPWAVPRPHEVFGEYDAEKGGWRTLSLGMDFVKGRTLHSLLESTWLTTPSAKRENALLFLEVLAQMACILFLLQRDLHLNHRDVKVNNILVRQRATPFTLRLNRHDFQTNLEVTLIDFGFACIGCPLSLPPSPLSPAASATEKEANPFQATTYFSSRERCCKVGRDLAQLIFCIHCYFPLHRFLPPEMFREVASWMRVGDVNLLNGFTEAGTPLPSPSPSPSSSGGRSGGVIVPVPAYHQGIYEFLRRMDVDVPACEPVTLFRACCRLKGTV